MGIASKSDFVIKFAGEGGQGLVTSADAIARAASTAGYYVQTFSTFPSQIMGGPASSQVRISTQPVLNGGDELDVLVALNREAYDLNVDQIASTGVVIYNSADFQLDLSSGMYFGLDAASIAKEVGNPRAQNMTLIGAVAEMIGFSVESVENYIRVRFDRGRPTDAAIVQSNIQAVRMGAKEALRTGFNAGRLANSDPPAEEQIMVTGNTAISLGAVAAGLDFYIGYPISPATTILIWMERNLFGDGRFAYQASSEIEAINAIVGAGFAGKKAMTATAGPGLSLMSEGIGLAWMAEIPCVIVDVQRGGPATGLPTKSEQSDLIVCMHPAHGDVKLPLIAPGSVEECMIAGALSVNWAERYQGPVMLVSEFSLADRAENIARPSLERLSREDRNTSHIENGFKRYSSWNDTGDGPELPPMPIPGGPGAYVANGSEHDEIGDTTHLPKHHVRLTERRFRKLSLLNDAPYEIEYPECETAIMPWGSSKGAAREAYTRLRDEGIEIGWIYSMALEPLPDEVKQALADKSLVIVPELNYQGQWSAMLRQNGFKAESITQYTGLPFRPATLVTSVKARLHAMDLLLAKSSKRGALV